MECSLFQGLVGIFRIFTLVFGVIVLGIAAYFFDVSVIGRVSCLIDYDPKKGLVSAVSISSFWEVLLAIVIITFIVSLTWVVLFILGIIVDSTMTKTWDMIYHIIGGVLLIIGGIIWIILESQTHRLLIIEISKVINYNYNYVDKNGKVINVNYNYFLAIAMTI